jgi:ubiquitin carboxyl-terminal hydrolase 5/13
MNSTLQSLFAFPTFQTRYLTSFLTHTSYCTNPAPATCFECQMSKIADGLLSGRYSVPRDTTYDQHDVGFSPGPDDAAAATAEAEAKPQVVFQEGIKPGMYKALVGKDHAEFSTMKQQDAGEFLLHLLELVRRSQKANPAGEDPTKMFGFALEERLQCESCKKVRYQRTDSELLPIVVPVKEKAKVEGAMEVEGEKKEEYEPVQLGDCLDSLTAPAELEYNCPTCDKKVTATK